MPQSSSANPGGSHAHDGAGRRMTRMRAAALLPFLVACAAVVTGCGNGAPSVTAWPLAPRTQVEASAETTSVITDADKRRYRVFIVGGPQGSNDTRLLDAAVRHALGRGWR